MERIIVTGGHGFIGSALIKELLKNKNYKVLNLDSNTYASNPNSLRLIKSNCCLFAANSGGGGIS